MIIDANDEYDVKNILEKKELGEKNVVKSIDAFTDEKEDNSFTLMLKTISKNLHIFSSSLLHLVFQILYLLFWKERVTML